MLIIIEGAIDREPINIDTYFSILSTITLEYDPFLRRPMFMLYS